MTALRSRLRDQIQRELDLLTARNGDLRDAASLRLVPLVGNGLSRFALRHSKGTDLSYNEIVEQLARDVGLASLDHLRARGYAVDEVFREAASRAHKNEGDDRIRQVLRDLWDAVRDVEPAPLHRQIAHLGRAFLTTNYDLLLELALHRVGRYRPNGRWPHPRMTKGSADSFRFPPPGDYPRNHPPLYKIHGSFPDLHDDGTLPDSGEINRWLRGAGPTAGVVPHRDLIVIDQETYDYWSWYCPEDKFKRKFSGPLKVLDDPNNLVVALGHGLSSEERILFRLRELVGRGAAEGRQLSARGLIPVFATDIDEPTVRLPYAIVRIHPALAGSPPKRELALMLLLSALVEREILDTRLTEVETNSFPELAWAGRIDAQTVMMGQLALHTNRGYEDAPAQERAYSPRAASWAPGMKENYFLETKEPFGDALVPSLLWDAIDLPCALEGRLGWDDAGRAVYDHLTWKTTSIDFTPVQQDADATEQATVASWFDLRLILDGPRHGAGGFRTDSRSLKTRSPVQDRAAAVSAALPPRPGVGRFLYVTKPGWSVAKALAQRGDLVVFDTGNNCNAATTAEVLTKPSLIIASALSLWLLFRSAEAVGRVAITPEKLAAAWRSLLENTRPDEEPKDETGRYEQFVGLLEALKRSDYSLLRSPIAPLLIHTVSVSVSLGPLGVLWWSCFDWSQAYWTRIEDRRTSRTKYAALTGQPLPFSEIRCGLGCGDSGRAGLAAALQLNPQVEPATLPHLSAELPSVLALAFEAMTWWGASRLMFWSITGTPPRGPEYAESIGNNEPRSLCDWLRSNKTAIREWLAGGDARPRPIWPDASRTRRLVTSPVIGAPKQRLENFARLWQTEIVSPRPREGRGAWVDAIKAWTQQRKLER
jgi:hypothetical protein